MLNELRIQNLVLFESATIPFAPGLNVLTGETGSGKSAIMAALRLIGGERGDADLIRHGFEKATVEAIFSPPSPELAHLLDESGIAFEKDEPLIIRRVIGASGKGKIHINHQPVLLSLLRTLSPYLFEMVTQHANQMLFSTEAHRQITDTFGRHSSNIKAFAECWNHEKELMDKRDNLEKLNSERLRLLSRYEAEIEELEGAHLKEGEEEELFAEYTRLTNADELASIIDTILEGLNGDQEPIIPQLKQHHLQLDKLEAIDKSCKDFSLTYKNILTELTELSYSLRSYRSGIEHNPIRTAKVNQRLTEINKIKRKYGPTVEDALSYLSETEEKRASRA